jgi:hypothetical protein
LALPSFDGSVGKQHQAKGRVDNYLQWWLKDSTLAGTFDLQPARFDLNELMGPPTLQIPPGAAEDTSAMQ